MKTYILVPSMYVQPDYMFTGTCIMVRIIIGSKPRWLSDQRTSYTAGEDVHEDILSTSIPTDPRHV